MTIKRRIPPCTVGERRAMEEATALARAQAEERRRASSYMSSKDVRVFIGGESNPLSKSALHQWIKTKGFPTPIFISPKYPIWKKQDVIDWLDAQREEESGL